MIRVFRQIIAFLVVCLIAFSSSAIELSGNLGFSKASSQMASDGARFGDWPRFHFDERNRGCSDFVTNLESLTQPNLIWSYDLPCLVYGSPVVADVDRDGSKEIFIDNAPTDEPGSGKAGGMLYCLNESGQLKWTFQPYEDPVYPGSWAFSTPALGDIDQNGYDEILYWSKSQYWSDYYQGLYCIDPNGTVRWSRHFSSSELFVNPAADNSIPTIANITDDEWPETVIQYAGNERVTCFNHEGGTVWSYWYGWTTGGWNQAYSLHTAPAVVDLDGDNSCETVLSISYENDSAPNIFKGGVLCVSSTGSLLWSRLDIRPQYYTYQEACSSPTVDDVNDDGFPEVFVGEFDGLYCLNRTGGNEWFYPVAAGVFNTVAIADVDADGSKEIVFGADDNYIYCLSNTGSLKWKYLTGGKIWSSAAIADIERPAGGEQGQLEIVVGSLDGKLYCLNSIGALRWTYNAGTPIYSSPAIVDLQYSGQGNPEIVFAANNRVYALRLNTAHDISISSIIVPKNTVGQGYSLPISVTVHNKGEFSENTNLTVYAGAAAIYSETLTNLQQHQDLVVNFNWNTAGWQSGDYTIEAAVDPVVEEYQVSDNRLVDGSVTIQAPVHDVAVTAISAGPSLINQGNNIYADVRIENQGNMMETFNVTVYANQTLVYMTTWTLDFGTSRYPDFAINASTLSEGYYTFSAIASPVPGETDILDNSLGDSGVTVIGPTFVCVSPLMTWVWPNETFTVDLKACNVINMEDWQVELDFNSSVLTWISGGYLAGDGNSVGDMGFVYPKVTGNYTFLQVTFKSKTEGLSYLHLGPITDIFMPFYTVDGQAGGVQHELMANQVRRIKTVAGQGSCAGVNATIINLGYSTETFNATLYVNTTAVQTQTVYNLTARNSASILFTWNTTAFSMGNYTVGVCVWPVPDEHDTINNNCTDGTIYVGIAGDITGNNVVDIYDAIVLAGAYNCRPGDRNWNGNADINGDLIVDIYDSIILANHYNQHYP